MAERTTITELAQVGVESTYGTTVAATKQLASLSIELSPEVDISAIRPTGFKVPTIDALIREWASGTLGGYPTYNELPYVFNCLLKRVTPVTAAGVSTWTYPWSPTAVETVDSLTVEQGDPNTRAELVNGAVVSAFNVGWTRSGAPRMGGSLLARRFNDGITMTPSLTFAPPIPILPSQIDVYADATWAGLGTTKLLKVTNAGLNIGSMWGPFWVLNTANTSFQTYVQQAPDITFTLALEFDSAGGAYFTQMRAGTMVFLRLQATGPVIGAGPATNRLRLDFSGTVGGAPRLGDDGGVRTIEWTFRCTVDGTSGNALAVEIVNAVPSL